VAIWVYNGVSNQPDYVWSGDTCTFCRSPMKLLHSKIDDLSRPRTGPHSYFKRLFVCSICGWWIADGRETNDDLGHGRHYHAVYGAAASLRELDLSDISTPINEVRSYLAAKYESRFTLHPKLFEETVASVFGNLGYTAEATAYSRDDGIDVILKRADETIGIQVKRYKDAIEVEQIRSLAGALLLNGFTRGIFVTTSTFQRGGKGTTEKFRSRGYEIELFDAQRFYEALKIAQREMYDSFAEFPVADCLNKLVEIDVRVYEDRWPFSGRF
jgi:restriction system protein